MNMMMSSSSLQIIFPARNKAVISNRHAKISPRVSVVFQPSSCMVIDGTSSLVRNVRPPMTSFRPSMWGDAFSTISFHDEKVQQKYSEEIETLVKEARTELILGATPTKLLILIDQLERLGLAYHFETEIEDVLKQVYESMQEEQAYDLFTISLRFRLLRQHQYHVSCDEFRKFVDKDAKWNESLCSDIEGLLSLYEAAHVRVQDEDVLDEAVEFTRHRLNSMLAEESEVDSPMKERVLKALEFPLHKNPKCFNLLSYIPIYENEDSRDELLLRLAKLNFNFLQNIYRKEIFELTAWWNKLDMKSKLPYSRERVVECYMWGIALRFEPQYSFVRTAIAKVFQMITIMDDTYDNYATLEEIEQFNHALDRWNMDAADELPDYFRIVYKFVMSGYENFKREAERRGKSFAVPMYKEAVKQLGKAYGREQEWIMERQMPSFEDYMMNSQITGVIYLSFIAIAPGLHTFTKENLDWLLTAPQIFLSTNMAGRLLDDLASYERESRDGNMVTVVDCYMKDKGVSREETISAFGEIIEDEWKNVNEAWVTSCGGGVPKEMLDQFLYVLRMTHLCYHNKQDGITDPEKLFKPLARALLLDPMLI